MRDKVRTSVLIWAMQWRTFIIGWILALAVLLFAQRRPAETPQHFGYRAVVDLTYKGALAVSGQHLDAAAFGTRMDSPIRQENESWTPLPITPDRLVAPLAVINVSAKVAADPTYQVSLADVAQWEELHGHVPPGAVVVARTGWHPPAVLPEDPPPHAAFAPEAVEFLVKARNVYGVGIDAPAVDAANNPQMPVRRLLGENQVYALANVANLEEAPEAGAVIVVAPTMIRNAAGAPARLLALVK